MWPQLTIAVPFVKGGHYLKRTLDSIFAQRSSGWEVMLVDNSTDPSEGSMAQELVRTYDPERIRYVKNDVHLSACENFNRCIEIAPTDLISTVHADDEVLPNYADELLALAQRHPESAILFVPVSIIGEDSKPRASFVDWIKRFLVPRGEGDLVLSDERSLRSLLRGDWINGAAICYRKSRLGDLRWDAALPMTSDLDLWSRAILSNRTMAGTRRPPAYAYRRHASQTTALLNSNLSRFREESHIYDIIAERALSRGWLSAAAVARKKTIIRLHLLFLLLQDILRGAVGRANQKFRLLKEIK
jgi:glycosyltransferase involved in cell wall biosynthesis